METIGFGNGADGVAVLTGTDAPIDSAAVGTAAATSLSATNPSFAAGQIILVIQMQGTNAGKAELNRISSYVAGTITTTRPLAYTYSCTGNDKAQVIVVPQHSKITMSGSFTGKAWDGTVGGIIAKFCNGEATIDQSLLGTGIGYRGGPSAGTGEGTSGEGYPRYGVFQETISNGNGAGGGVSAAPGKVGSAGGGGGHAAEGTQGGPGDGTGGGDGGLTIGDSTFDNLFPGGGGGAGSGNRTDQTGGAGGAGGGIILLFCQSITVTGAIRSNGAVGSNAGSGAGGGGAGGLIFIRAGTATIGTGLITAKGAAGGIGGGSSGGAGGDGRIRIEACKITGTTDPSMTITTTALPWCAGPMGIL